MLRRFRWPGVALALGFALWLPVPAGARDAGDGPRAEEPGGLPSQGPPGVGDPVTLEPDPLFDDLEFGPDFSERDPFESSNRAIFAFNERIDWLILDPVTHGYQFLVPGPARRGIYRMFLNVNSSSVLVNEILQARFTDAAKTFGRFILNSTVGIAGMFDAGKEAGWERTEADFGQTLALAGVRSGPYLMLPLFGPSTVRDGIGDVIDRLLEPLTWIIGPGALLFYYGGSAGFVTREAHVDDLAALEESAVDFYAVLRSAYLQSRDAKIREGCGPECAASAATLRDSESRP